MGGGQRADHVRLLPFGQFAGFHGDPDGPLAVPDRIIRTRGEHPSEIVQDRVVVRLQFHGLFEVGNRRGVIADGDLGIPASAPGEKLLRIDLQRAIEAADRLPWFLGCEVEEAELADDDGVVGALADESTEIGDRRRIIALVGREQGAELEGRRVVGVAGEYVCDVGEGVVGAAGLLVQPGPEDAGLGRIGGRGDRPIEIGQRTLEVSLRREHPPALEEDICGVGGKFEGVVEVLEGVVGPLRHEQRQAAHLTDPDIVRILRDRHVEVRQGPFLIPLHHQEQPARPSDIGIPRGKLDRLVVGGTTSRWIVFSEIPQHDVGLGRLQRVVADDLDRPAGGAHGPLPIPPGQRLEASDHHVRRSERVVALHHFSQISQRVGPHPLPLLLGPRGAVEQGFGEHRRPIDQRAGVEVVGKPARRLLEPFPEGGSNQTEDPLEIIEGPGRQLGIDSRVEILLPRRRGRGTLDGRFIGVEREACRRVQQHRCRSQEAPAATEAIRTLRRRRQKTADMRENVHRVVSSRGHGGRTDRHPRSPQYATGPTFGARRIGGRGKRPVGPAGAAGASQRGGEVATAEDHAADDIRHAPDTEKNAVVNEEIRPAHCGVPDQPLRFVGIQKGKVADPAKRPAHPPDELRQQGEDVKAGHRADRPPAIAVGR